MMIDKIIEKYLCELTDATKEKRRLAKEEQIKQYQLKHEKEEEETRERVLRNPFKYIYENGWGREPDEKTKKYLMDVVGDIKRDCGDIIKVYKQSGSMAFNVPSDNILAYHDIGFVQEAIGIRGSTDFRYSDNDLFDIMISFFEKVLKTKKENIYSCGNTDRYNQLKSYVLFPVDGSDYMLKDEYKSTNNFSEYIDKGYEIFLGYVKSNDELEKHINPKGIRMTPSVLKKKILVFIYNFKKWDYKITPDGKNFFDVFMKDVFLKKFIITNLQ